MAARFSVVPSALALLLLATSSTGAADAGCDQRCVWACLLERWPAVPSTPTAELKLCLSSCQGCGAAPAVLRRCLAVSNPASKRASLVTLQSCEASTQWTLKAMEEQAQGEAPFLLQAADGACLSVADRSNRGPAASSTAATAAAARGGVPTRSRELVLGSCAGEAGWSWQQPASSGESSTSSGAGPIQHVASGLCLAVNATVSGSDRQAGFDLGAQLLAVPCARLPSPRLPSLCDPNTPDDADVRAQWVLEKVGESSSWLWLEGGGGGGSYGGQHSSCPAPDGDLADLFLMGDLARLSSAPKPKPAPVPRGDS